MKNLTFCAFVAILLLLLFSVYGCGGARNTDLSQSETKTDNINIENSYSMGSKIVLMDIFTAKPIDALKPMWIDGKEYKNASIINNKSKIKIVVLALKTKYNITKTIVIEKNKTTDKTNYIYLWLGLAFIICLFVFLWFYLPKLKTGI